MDVGPDKLRQRATAAPTPFTIELRLTRTQVALLDAFYRTTTAHGTLAFTWKHHRTGNTIDYRFLGAPRLQPLASRQGGTEYWAASFVAEAMPGTEVVEPPPPPPPPPPEPEPLPIIFDEGGGAGLAPSLDAITYFDEGTFAPTPDDRSFVFVFDDVGAFADGSAIVGANEGGTSTGTTIAGMESIAVVPSTSDF